MSEVAQTVQAVEPDRAGKDTGPIPPISKTEVEADIAWLKVEAEEAGKLVNQLKLKQQDALRLLAEIDNQIREAEAKRDKAVDAYSKVVPKKLPPIPRLEEMLMMARKQRPDGDDRETVKLVSRLRGTLHSALAGEGLNKSLPAITGTDIRNTEDHHYDIPAAPRGRKTYGEGEGE